MEEISVLSPSQQVPVIRFRPFLNTDVPHIVNIWRQQQRFKGFFSAINSEWLDLMVLSKPYFEHSGLILAIDEQAGGTPVGFIHAGFGPNESLSDMDSQAGILSQLKVVPREDDSQIAGGLINHAIHYLQQRGATSVEIGSKFPHAPFYLGLYGGSRVPGIMHDDLIARFALQDRGFGYDDEVLLMKLELAGFRPNVDRDQMALRRQYQVKTTEDPMETSWWECCLFSHSERVRFTLHSKTNSAPIGAVCFWDMLPIASEFGMSCRGLYDLHIAPEFRRRGMATFLINEALKGLKQLGIVQVEVQVRHSDIASLQFFDKLGFEKFAVAYQMSLKLLA